MEGTKAYSGTTNKPRTGRLELSRKMETGFPSPASDHLEKALSLEDLVVYRPSATFYVRAEGNAMERSGIHHHDILIVDRSIHPKEGAIVIASVDQEPIIRRFVRKGSRIFLISDDPRFEPVTIYEDTEWIIWGVVTHVIHKFQLEEAQSQHLYRR